MRKKKIKKVREIKKEKGSPALPDVVTGTEEYYVYQEKSGYGQNGSTTSQGLKIAKDATVSYTHLTLPTSDLV